MAGRKQMVQSVRTGRSGRAALGGRAAQGVQAAGRMQPMAGVGAAPRASVAAGVQGGSAFLEPGRVRGRVVGIERSQSFPDARGKRAAWLSGARWQFGQNQWTTTAVYVVPEGAEGSAVQRCVHVDGDLAGAVRPGNVVDVEIHTRHGRLVADRMVNETTQAEVPVGAGMLPAGSLGVVLIGIVAVLVLGALVVVALTSGVFAQALLAVLGVVVQAAATVLDQVARALLPVVIPVMLLAVMLRAIFPR